MKNLKKLAKENAQKGSWVRSSVEKFMDAWSDTTEDCELIRSESPVYMRDTPYMAERFYLVTGTIELKAIDDDHGFYDVHDSKRFWDALSIADIRAIFTKIPTSIESIETQLEKANTANGALVDKLSKLIAVLNSNE